ncbi:MAG: hypothetical protein K6G19_00665, partial [Lachnospiraceae bacterium]|nr:hypothetical protein [Lachnospiraceae bacterium]
MKAKVENEIEEIEKIIENAEEATDSAETASFSPAVTEEKQVESEEGQAADQAVTTPVVIDYGRIENIEEFQSPEALYHELTDRLRKYHPSEDISLIQKAYETAGRFHKDQKR